jgi:PAS domain S-box-containing protein
MQAKAPSHIGNRAGMIDPTDEFQHNLYDLLPGLIFIYDLQGNRLRYANKKALQLVGLSEKEVQSHADLQTIIYREDLSTVKDALIRFANLNADDEYGFVCRINTREGTAISCQVTGKTIERNHAGQAVSVWLLAQEIKSLNVVGVKHPDGLIEDTEDLLQFATCTWDALSGKVQWSHGIKALLNYETLDPSKLSGEFFMEHVVPADRDRIERLYKKAVQEKQHFLTYEYSVIADDKEVKRLRTQLKFRYADGKLIGTFGISKDITEKSTLLTSLLTYRDMVMEKERFLGQGTWEMDLDTRIAAWSDGMYHLFGYDPERERGNLIINETLYQKHLSTEDYDKGKALRKAALEREDSYVWEYEIRTASGETKQLETYGKIIRDPKGEPRKVIGTTRDVTKMVNYERELERTIADLKRSNKDLEDFAYVASHDMHEPLRKIFSFADRLQTRHSASLSEEANGYIARILTSTQNARQMIDGLMQFSRLSTKGHWFEKVNLNDVLAEVLTDLEIPIEETKAKVDVGLLPEMDAIRTQIKQLFTNLISNALKFRKPGFTPEILVRSKKLSRAEMDELNLGLNKPHYKITVHDNGIGFEEEYAEVIFQMFQRLNSKGEYPGSGIGLALCKKIVENHQGIIRASSKLGEGTEISVIIPSNLSRNA